MVSHPRVSPQRQWMEARPAMAMPRTQQSHQLNASTRVTAVDPMVWAKAKELLGKTRTCTNGGQTPNKIDRAVASGRSPDRVSSRGSCAGQDDSNQDRMSEVSELAGVNTSSPASKSQVDEIKRELKALEQRYFRMRDQLDKARDQNHRLRSEARSAIAQRSKTEREVSKLRQLLDRLQAEKKQIESQAIANRDYAHKMEQRFFLGTKAQSLLECNLELHAQIQTLKEEMKALQDESERNNCELDDTRGRLALTQRALDLRIESLAPAANGSVHAGMLLEMAKLQDQLAAMAEQLSRERASLRSSEKQKEIAHKESHTLEQRLAECEAIVAVLERDRAVVDEKLARVVGDAQTLACEKATLLKFVQQQAEAKFQLEAALKSVQDEKLRACAALQQKLESALNENRLEHERVRDLERNLEAKMVALQTSETAVRAQQDENLELQSRISAMVEEAQRNYSQRRAVDDELIAAKDICRELQLRLDSSTGEIEVLRGEVAAVKAAKSELETELSHKNNEQTALQEAMETALRDLEALSKQRNEAARAMNEAVTISASSLEEQQTLEAAVERQRKQLEQLKTAKAMMQNAMLEQLAALRKQLHAERARRVETEAKLTEMIKFSSTRAKHATPNGKLPDQACSSDPNVPSLPTQGELEAQQQVSEPRLLPLPSPHAPPQLPVQVASIQSPVRNGQLEAAVALLAASTSSLASSHSSSSSSLSSSSSMEDVTRADIVVRSPELVIPTFQSHDEYVEESSHTQLSLLELAGDI